MLTFTDYITESRLNARELIKPNSQTGEPRVSILRNLIKTGTPLELHKGGVAKVIDIDHAMRAIDQFEKDNKVFELKVDKGGTIALTQLKKSKDFGGGVGGAGGGSVQTKHVESAQCLWCAAMVDAGPNEPFEYFTDDVLRAAQRNVSVDAKLIDMLQISDEWKMSAYLTAQALIKNNYITKGMIFHRGDKFMKEIYDAKTTAFKNLDLRPISHDKWNPGDIWASMPSFNVRKDINTETVVDLKKTILEHFSTRQLVAISLKQVQKVARIKEYNIEYPPDIDNHKMIRFAAHTLTNNKPDAFWTTKGGEVEFDAGKISIRDNAAYGIIKAELIGKNARGGGVSWGIISSKASQVFRINNPSVRDISRKAIKISKGDVVELKRMYDVVNDVYPITFEEFAAGIATKDGVWIHAKYGVCLFLRPLAKFGGSRADDFITKIVNYAGSKDEDSSSYIKVY